MKSDYRDLNVVLLTPAISHRLWLERKAFPFWSATSALAMETGILLVSDIQHWEEDTGQKLNEIYYSKQLTTLPAVYNVMAMAARP